FWYKPETDRLIVLFGEVGGHAATGVRLNPQVEAKQSEPQLPIGEQKPADESSSSNSKDSTTELHKPGDKIEIEWSGQWYKGSVLEVNDGKFKVRYTDWGSLYDEWVSPDRVRRLSQ